MILKYFNSKENNFIFNFWFAGILVLLYFILKNFFEIGVERLEWSLYIITFLILIIYCFFSEYFNFNSRYLKLFLVVPFLIYIFLLLSYSNFLISLFFSLTYFLFTSNLLEIKKKYLYKIIPSLIIYFIIFLLFLKIFYINSFEDFLFYRTTNILPNFTIFAIPLIILLIYIFSIFSINSIKFNKPINKYWKKYWWILPFAIFFLESFNTSNFFSIKGGGAFHHWQPYTGVLEMMEQGGYLLWDIPSQYGFLSLLSIYILPFNDNWLKVYYFNGIINLIISLVSFYLIWNKKGITWYFLTLLLVFSIFYILTTGSLFFVNTSTVISNGGIRYLWFFLILSTFYFSRNYNLLFQSYIILPFWLLGFLWSVESAVYTSSLIGGYILYICFFSNLDVKYRLFIFLLFPASLSLLVFLISLFYIFNLGHLPDYYSFFEYIFFYIEKDTGAPNNGSPTTINLSGCVWIIILIFTIFFWIKDKVQKKFKHIWFITIFGLWSILSLTVSQSHEGSFVNLLCFFVISFFITLNLLKNNYFYESLRLFYPLISLILIFTFGNIQIINHIYNTITNQDYFFENVFYSKSPELNELLNQIKPEKIPIQYIERGRYLNYLYPKEYIENKTNKKIKLNHNIWLPLHPATLFEPLNEKRRNIYISRWLDRKDYKMGWLINSKDDDWHTSIEKTLRYSLKDYKIIKKVYHGNHKAFLYEKL